MKNPFSSRQQSNSSTDKRLSCRVSLSRTIFIASLLVVAVLLGFFAFRQVSESERKLGEEQFNAIADRALATAVKSTLRKRRGVTTLATVFAQAFPQAETWPMVDFNGFEEVSAEVIETSDGRTMGLLPLVTSDRLLEFEDFVYNDLFPKHYPDKDDVGVSSFGQGVYGVDITLNTTDMRFPERENGGKTTWGSPYDVITPFLYHSLGSAILLGNLHYSKTFGVVIDDVISCSKEREEDIFSRSKDEDKPTVRQCTVLSDFLFLRDSKHKSSQTPGAIIVQPVYPADDEEALVGFISSTIVWEEALHGVFSKKVTGIDCVIKSDTASHTFEVASGVPVFKGEGDLHDGANDKYAKTTSLNPDGLFSDKSFQYTLTLYPNKDFFHVYSTTNPSLVVIGAVCTVLLVSVMFIVYDCLVRMEFRRKQEILQARRDFVRYVSHEVRTPLQTVCLQLELLQSSVSSFLTTRNENKLPLRSPDKLQQTLLEWLEQSDDVNRGTRGAVEVLNDLLLFDKVESGTLCLELSIVPIWTLIDHTFQEFKAQAESHNINYSLESKEIDKQSKVSDIESCCCSEPLDQDLRALSVVGDEIRITEVIRNLISNALKFTPEGESVTVRLNYEEISHNAAGAFDQFKLQDGEVLSLSKKVLLKVEVLDTGSGMSRNQTEKLFGEGVQFHKNKSQKGGGSGLGLFISKGIIEQHGGSLTVVSEGIGHGTKFTITLPLYAVAAPKASSDKCEQKVSRLRPLRLLVVDDSAMNRKLLTRILENQGHTCEEAEDGVEALKQVEAALTNEDPYDSILLDYEMPNMNGPTAASEMRKMKCESFMVGITGNLFDEDKEYFRACGVNKVLPKPIQICDLIALWTENDIGTSPILLDAFKQSATGPISPDSPEYSRQNVLIETEVQPLGMLDRNPQEESRVDKLSDKFV